MGLFERIAIGVLLLWVVVVPGRLSSRHARERRARDARRIHSDRSLMDYVQAGAVAIHTLAMILVVGYYGILGRVILPALRGSLAGPELATTLLSVERRARPLLVLSVGLFVATGAFLLLADDQSRGIGSFLATTWTTLMLAKHGLIVVMVVLAAVVDFLVSEVSYAETDLERDRLLGRLCLSTEATTAVGAFVVLLTAAAQVS